MASTSPHSKSFDSVVPSPAVSVMTATRGTMARASLARPQPGPWPAAGLRTLGVPASSQLAFPISGSSGGFMAHRAAHAPMAHRSNAAPMAPQQLLTVPEPLMLRRGSEPLVPGAKLGSPVWPAPRSGGALWSHTHPPDPTFGDFTFGSPRPAIVSAPTLGVVPLTSETHDTPHGPSTWPQFHLRFGELCYLMAYPGDKRRDSCSELLRGMGLGPIDGMDHRDISVVQGSRHAPWLVSPTVARGRYFKMRYAVDAQGRWCAALEASSPESVLRVMRRELFGRGIMGMEIMLDRVNEGAEPLDGLSARLRRTVTVQHFAHSLALGELFCGQEVHDTINCDGKLLGMVPLRAHPGAAQLRALSPALRKTLARSLLLSLAKLLRDMHDRQVVHHNVCLDNVLLAPSRATLCGLLSAHATAQRGMPPERTPTHVPPEMALHEAGTGRAADVWALGMALMRLLCGDQAFLVAAEVAHERDLSPTMWRGYIGWHRALLGPKRPAHATQPLLTPLQAQLKRGYAAAHAVDGELTTFLVHRLLTPQGSDRLAGDALVSAAAALSRGTNAREAKALDQLLADDASGLARPMRPDVLARMAELLPRWSHGLQARAAASGVPL